jgi:hypothetical protein
MADASSNDNGQRAAKIMENMNWPTVALIALTGGGNLLSSWQNRSQIDTGREQVIRQVSDLHNSLDDFERRQKQMLDGIHDSLNNQSAMLNNQRDILTQLKKTNP